MPTNLREKRGQIVMQQYDESNKYVKKVIFNFIT